MTQAAKFRAMLKSGKMIVAPGAIDCITGKLIDQAGFEAVYMTGAGTSATLGYPDYGLITMSEMVGNASRIANSISVPLISDSDTGFGNELNVFRTVQEFERAGVAAIHIEDQVFPKKCGHLEGKELVSREDYIAKIRAAAAAKRTPDFTIIARTDARAVAGFDEAITRARLALAAGADAVFVEAPQTMEEVEQVPKLVKGPCLLNMVRGGKTPEVPLADAERMGYAISILPGLLLGNIIAICDQTLAEVKRLGKFPPPLVESSPAKTFARFGAADWDARRTAFRDEIKAAAE
jgi:2-methylisocitrate lyase-like PEP mutase family enzyme